MNPGRVHFVLDRGETYAYAKGHGSRELLTDAGCRPVWGSITRAWATTYRQALDAIALAERRNWIVTTEWVGQPRPVAPVSPVVTLSEPGQESLW